MVNQIVLHMVKDLKQASKKNEAPIWSKLADLALKSSSSKPTVNLTRINKITLSSFSISITARNKIIKSGGNIMAYSEMIKKFPTGKGVRIFG